jgi:phage terminase large subunit GpA-like protein
MFDLDKIGADWIGEQAEALTHEIKRVKPSTFNEENRYLPESVTSMPGYIRYDVNPYMREIIDCCDINSRVREVTVKKGVQITYTTLLESVMLYFMAEVQTLPGMYITADKELAEARIENNFLPMIEQSGLSHLVRSSDEGNSRKTGKTKNHIQWEKGGYLVPFGAKNANKMRSYSICFMLKDEIDAWPDVVGKDGDPETLTDDRCSGYWERRKIYRGSTPLIKGMSKIDEAYKRGDQRKYMVLCKACGYPQSLRWETVDKKTGVVGGFQWEIKDGVLDLDSVCYCCQKCGEKHYEADKERLFSPEHGAHWKPTARPAEPGIRSYHLPAMYSPIGMQPWYKCVSAYLKGFDPVAKKVIDVGKYQVFYNNILGESFEILGSKVTFMAASAHRRAEYKMGEIPNEYALRHCGSKILFLTCQVDVHKSNLAVAVMGWAKDSKCFLIHYDRYELSEGEDDCGEITSPVWGRLRELIEETVFKASDGTQYRLLLTLIDAGYASATVTSFCAEYASSVYPILGRDRAAKNQTVKEFAEFKTQDGTIGYRILVDHYKERLAPVLRREWVPDKGEQKKYHFNAPIDTSDKQIKELTVETRRKKKDDLGRESYEWYRPGNARNELWDLLVYGHAAVEIFAWTLCVKYFELENIDWRNFWSYIIEQHDKAQDIFDSEALTKAAASAKVDSGNKSS